MSRTGEDRAEESLPIGKQAWESASIFKKFICMDVLLEYMSVHHLHCWYPESPERSIQSLGTGVKEGCTHQVCGRN